MNLSTEWKLRKKKKTSNYSILNTGFISLVSLIYQSLCLSDCIDNVGANTVEYVLYGIRLEYSFIMVITLFNITVSRTWALCAFVKTEIIYCWHRLNLCGSWTCRKRYGFLFDRKKALNNLVKGKNSFHEPISLIEYWVVPYHLWIVYEHRDRRRLWRRQLNELQENKTGTDTALVVKAQEYVSFKSDL